MFYLIQFNLLYSTFTRFYLEYYLILIKLKQLGHFKDIMFIYFLLNMFLLNSFPFK